jgi:hypothetical protein
MVWQAPGISSRRPEDVDHASAALAKLSKTDGIVARPAKIMAPGGQPATESSLVNQAGRENMMLGSPFSPALFGPAITKWKEVVHHALAALLAIRNRGTSWIGHQSLAPGLLRPCSSPPVPTMMVNRNLGDGLAMLGVVAMRLCFAV